MHTKAQAKAHALALKLGASADPTRNDNEAERAVALAKLIALCEKHKLTLSDYVKPVASPDSGETFATGADGETSIRAAANRTATRAYYAGPSQASHAKRAPKLAEALARVASPVQIAKSASPRDASMLAALFDRGHVTGDTFCPIAATCDLGVLSRLASLGMLSVAGDRIKLDKRAIDLATLTRRKAA